MKVQYVLERKELDNIVLDYVQRHLMPNNKGFELSEIEYCYCVINGQTEFSHIQVRGILDTE